MLLRIVRPFMFVAVASAATAPSTPMPISRPDSASLAGAWVLNPALTERPQEIGFSRDWARAGGEGSGRAGGGRGRRGGSGSGGSAAGTPQISRESAEDSTRVD